MADPQGGVPEWPKGTGCKPVGSAFRGSNPLSPTSHLRAWASERPARGGPFSRARTDSGLAGGGAAALAAGSLLLRGRAALLRAPARAGLLAAARRRSWRVGDLRRAL